MSSKIGSKLVCVGASTVKWTSPIPCIVFSEMIQNYTLSFEFCGELIINLLKTYWSKKIQANYAGFFLKKSLHILEEGASGVQVGEIEQLHV